MPIRDAILAEFDNEMITTRKLLERVPAEKSEWKPHEKASTLGKLSMHVATLPRFVKRTMQQTELDFNPPDGERTTTPPQFESVEKMLATFDAIVAEAHGLIAEADDDSLRVIWTAKNRGNTFFTLPRKGVLRTFVMNHLIHHRGQLSVYLRALDVPLSSIYGPTADEPF